MKELGLDVQSAIAGEIMTPYVIMLEINAIFEDIIKVLKRNRISAVFICDEIKNEYYVVSETDIIDFLDRGGMYKENIAKIQAAEIMNGPIQLLDVETPIDKVIRFMAERKYKRVLISKKGKAAGVISTRDIMKWNNTYFKPAKPQILLFMDNKASTFIARHIFEENIEDDIKRELIDLYGGALNTISIMFDELIKGSGKISQFSKERRSVLFEPYQNITGILICDYNSIDLKRKLRNATKKFFESHSKLLKQANSKNLAIYTCLDINPVIPIFKNT